MLAALSNPLDKRRADVVEAAAEAFDRELLYLSAAFDIYGRLYRTLIDPSIDMDDVRDSLDSRAFIAKHLRPQYDESLLGDVVRLQVYAWVCKQLRNHIHKGILQVVPQPGRQYGNATNVALMLGGIPELAPGADNGMKQDHYDALGMWMADPVSIFGTPAMVADLATAGFTLMGTALEYVEAFTKLILRNKPAAMITVEQAAAKQETGDGTADPGVRSVSEPFSGSDIYFRDRIAPLLAAGAAQLRPGAQRHQPARGGAGKLRRRAQAQGPNCRGAQQSRQRAGHARPQARRRSRAYERAIELKPDYAEAHLQSRQRAQKLGRYDEALNASTARWR